MQSLVATFQKPKLGQLIDGVGIDQFHGLELRPRWHSVGNMSITPHISPETIPAGILPGHRAIRGTRMPPSQDVDFMPRSPPELPPNQGLLSEAKMNSTFDSKVQFRDPPQDAAHGPIQFPNHVRVEILPRFRRVEFLRGGQRLVGHGVRQVKEEGPLLIPLEKAQRAPGVFVGQFALHDRIRHDALVLHELHRPHVVRIEDAIVFVEPLRARKELRLCARIWRSAQSART